MFSNIFFKINKRIIKSLISKNTQNITFEEINLNHR